MSDLNKHILFVPIKAHSERIPHKNLTVVGGKPLYQWFLDTALQSKCFDQIVVDTDSPEITEWCSGAIGANGIAVQTIQRKPELSKDTANGNLLLREHYDEYFVRRRCNYSFIWQGFVTTPLISVKTVRQMVSGLTLSGGSFDSIMTVRVIKGFFWTDDFQPINHRTDVMPRSQDLPPIIMERHGLFGVKTESFLYTRTRYGMLPARYALPVDEDYDLDWPDDLEILDKELRRRAPI